MKKKNNKKYPQINQYLDCKEEVRELERLLYEARERYRVKARNIKKQSWSDWGREWYEWFVSYDRTIDKKLLEVRLEKQKYETDIIFDHDREDLGSSVSSLIHDVSNTIEQGYKNYHKYLNNDDDLDSDVI